VGRGNNNVGIAGSAPYCSLMGIRWGTTQTSDSDGFYWAETNGADVISCSWGTLMDDVLFEAIQRAATKGRNGLGCTVLFAAGNTDDVIPVNDPSRHPNVICVAASNCQDKRASYSSYGDSVSVTAPSSDDGQGLLGITTTDVPGTPGYSSDSYCRATDGTGFGGTSSATPLVAGIAALCLAVEPALNASNVQALLQETADKIDSNAYPYVSGWNRYLGYGRVNAHQALQLAPGYTNTPVRRFFGLYDAKGKLNYARRKLKLKFIHENRSLEGYNGTTEVLLNEALAEEFGAAGAQWRWNGRQTRGKARNASGSILKLLYSKKKAKVVVKLKNVALPAAGEQVRVHLEFGRYGAGEAMVDPDVHGKVKAARSTP
jgi:hypothetical protein